ncbi:hypothetical protein PENSPDRAFT_688958 [Peniophora sp. CONT]|nr:hypothetical protein PENSPDRAFT_688958 [Peniophora sp. CONT]
MSYYSPSYLIPQRYSSFHPSFGPPAVLLPSIPFSVNSTAERQPGVAFRPEYRHPLSVPSRSVTVPRNPNSYAMLSTWDDHVRQHVPSPVLHALLDGSRVLPWDTPAQADLRAPYLTLYRGGLPLPSSECDVPATQPMLGQVRIVCDVLPQWPIDILVAGRTMTAYRPERPVIQCLTVGDIIHAVYANLQKQITREEWAHLSSSQAAKVSRAFDRRCKAYTSAGHRVRRAGVLRVDFLGKKCQFRGLVWLTPVNGVDRARLILGDI